MRSRRPSCLLARLVAWVLMLVLLPASPAVSGVVAPMSVRSAPRLSLTIGKSIILQSDVDISRVSVAQPEIADFVLLSPRQIYVTGRAPGLTNLTLWDKGDKIRTVYDLDVAPDVSRLKRMIHEVMADETGIEVMATQDSITLSGSVRSAENVKKALSLAEVYAPKKVVNLLSVGGVQQVMLEVRVAEMSKKVVENMGINLNAIGEGNFVYTLLGGLSSIAPTMFDAYSPTRQYFYVQSSSGGGVQLPLQQFMSKEFNPPTTQNTASISSSYAPGNLSQSTATGAFRFNTNWGGLGNTTWTTVINMLKENGLAKILAEPNLVCINGQTANFLAGGEIPVPVPSGLGTVGIEWKKFGVQLKFTPTLVGDRISLQVNPEVSDLDYSNAVQVQGFTIPAITSRATATTVELKDGQSFAIAGMLKDNTRSIADKYPILGDIPVLGNLFKSSAYQKDQTELVIIITPHLAKPLDKNAIQLPTDMAHETDDLEFFLGITRDGNPKAKTVAGLAVGTAELDGDFGHAVPVAAVERPLTQ